MIRLSTVIEQFEQDFLSQYEQKILPSQRKAIHAMKTCRNRFSPKMQVHCEHCHTDQFIPHSCGNRNCPHCQHHENQQWLENQCRKLLTGQYFLLTFTVPAPLRAIFFQNQHTCYSLLFECVRDTLQTFCLNDKQLNGSAGITAVLHTHTRALEYHPHIHALMPAVAIDKNKRCCRRKSGKFLFSHKALASVFRAKMLDAINKTGLNVPENCPPKWVVDCKSVGKGEKTLIYLSRYLYRGVISENNILSIENGQVTFRYLDSKTKQYQTKTLPGADFLWLVLQHILPKGFRRTRNYGFLHPNSKTLIKLLQLLFRIQPGQWLKQIKPRAKLVCPCCGKGMQIIKTGIPAKPVPI